jgi:hypothetical protein
VFSLTLQSVDNQGKTSTAGLGSLRFVDPTQLGGFPGFQNAWFGGSGAQSAFSVDPFRFGIPNGLAYALGMDPRFPDRTRLPEPRIETDANGRYLVCSAEILDSGVNYRFLGGSNLSQSMAQLPAQQVSEAASQPGFKRITARVPLSGTGPARQFVRLEVSQP